MKSFLEYYNLKNPPGIRLKPIAKRILEILRKRNETFQSIANKIKDTTEEDIDTSLTFLITTNKIKYDTKLGQYCRK